MLAVIFQCGVKRVFAAGWHERSEFSSSGFYHGNRVSEPVEYIIFQVFGDGIQSFQFSQDFAPEYNSSLGNSFFSSISPGNITGKRRQQDRSGNYFNVIDDHSISIVIERLFINLRACRFTVMPACPESFFKQDSRLALLAGMTNK